MEYLNNLSSIFRSVPRFNDLSSSTHISQHNALSPAITKSSESSASSKITANIGGTLVRGLRPNSTYVDLPLQFGNDVIITVRVQAAHRCEKYLHKLRL